MDEKPDQIMNHIESQRDQLGRNLERTRDSGEAHDRLAGAV